MYNWKSCTLGGEEITSLRLNGDLVWEKLKNVPGYYAIVSSKNVISTLTSDSFKVLPKSGEEIIASDKGILVVLINEVIPEYQVYDPTFDWSETIQLGKGTTTTGESKIIGETEYSLWYKTTPTLQSGTLFKINY